MWKNFVTFGGEFVTHFLPYSNMPRAKIVDTKPRGRMSAYAFFVQSCREEHKKKHPDENVVFSEFSRKCAERWKVRWFKNTCL